MKTLLISTTVALALGGCAVYQTDGPDPAKASEKVYVCHKETRTLHIDDAAVRAHLDHGDRLGRC